MHGARAHIRGLFTRPLRSPWRSSLAAGATAFLLVGPAASGQGGYYPSAWGWLGMAAAWTALLALTLRRDITFSWFGIATLAGWAAFTLWSIVSLMWSPSTTNTLLQVERVVMYLTVASALLVVCRPRTAYALLAGAWTAIVTVGTYSLTTHLLPDRFGVYTDPLQAGRLFQPLGYWNALGIFTSLGMLLAVGLFEHPGRRLARMLFLCSLPVLATTTYFTFSRGAWLAAGCGVVCVVGVSPRRLRYITTLLVASPITAATVAYAASLGPLTASHAMIPRIESAGARAAVAVCAGTVAQGLVAAALMSTQRRLTPGKAVRKGYAATLAAAVIGGLAILVAVAGPIHTIHKLDRQLTASAAPPKDLNDRLLSVSLSDRQYLWRAALSEYEHHRLLGGGAGSYADYWLQHRPLNDFVVNAHSLYLETLAELGPIGVAMLLLLLVPPLIVAVRSRANPLIAPALGAYTAYLGHAAVDWDWQVPAVTIVAMITAAVILLQDRSADSVTLGAAGRWIGGLVLLFVGLLSATGLAANHAASQGLTALGDRQPAAALGDARTAMTFAPWSDEPYLIAGRANQQLRQPEAALNSYRKAAAHDPADWVAWAAIANVSTGGAHRAALRRLRALDPRYDLVDGRP